MGARPVCTFLVLLVVWAGGLIAPNIGMAQIGGSGSIQGTISDPSGAVVPGAAVVATNVRTGVKTSRVTTGAGVYVLSPLPAGEYNVSVSASGFQSLVQEHVIVDALSVVGLNLTLQVGAEAQQVTVSDTPPALSTADARLGQTMRNEEYSSLPLTMGGGTPRNPLQFAFLLPGVTNTSRWGNTLGAQDFSNDVYVEGIAITNSVQQGEGRNLSLGVSVDAVDQFQLETAGAEVQYNGQGVQNYVIKSGTNKFHGSVFEYFRNTVLDARGFFAPSRPKQNQNEFGYTFGGPIKKDRIFFFSSYDGYQYRSATRASFTSIPTLAQRRGDFSALPVTIYDPATTNCSSGPCTRLPFPGNIIPESRISPISRYFQSFLPDPTNSNLQNNYLGSVPVGYANHNSTNKVDVNLSDAHRFSAVFSHGKRSQTTPYRGGTMPLPYAVTRLVEEIPTTAQAKHTWVFSPTLLNQFDFGFSRLWVPIANATVDGKYPQRAGLKGLPAGEAADSFPEVAFAGPNSPNGWRGTDARAFTEALNTFTLQDNMQWVRGKHAITFGFQMQWMHANEMERTYGSLAIFNFSNNQTLGFNPSGTRLTNTGHSYASFLLGELNSATVIEDWVVGTGGRFRNYAWWLQDNFKLSRRLNLNLGLRYDLMEPYKEVRDRMSFMNPDLPNPAASGRLGALQFAGFGENSCKCRTPIDTYYGNWGPRVGFAYSLTSKTVMRGSYSIMYSRRGAVGGRGGARNGTGLLGYSASVFFGANPNGYGSVFDWDAGVPVYQKAPFFNPALNTGFTTTTPQAGGVTFGDPFIGGRPPRYQNWSFGFQHAVTSTTTLGLSYVGSNGHNLGGGGRGIWSNQIDPKYLALGNLLTQSATPANIAAARAIFPEIGLPFANFSPNAAISQMLRPFPQYSGVTDIWGDVANSKYNSMQITLQQRRANGLAVNWNYTFARVMDDTAGNRSAYNWKTEKAVAMQDISHIMNATYVYQLPFGAGRSIGNGIPVVRHIIGGWQISGITQFSTGQPLGSIGAACNLPNAGGCYADYSRNFSGPPRINGDYGNGDLSGPNPPSFIDRNAFVSPAPFTYGDTPRTLAHGLRGSHRFNQDMSLRREFRIREGLQFSFQADAINLLNNVYFGGIGTNITNANFGRVSSQINSPRSVQFAARVSF